MQTRDPLELYKQLLSSIGYRIENGLVSEEDSSGGYRPTIVRNQRLVVPTGDILRTADWKKMMAFHPLCENAEGAPSAILKLLNARITMKLNARLAGLMLDLMLLSLDTNKQTILSPQQVAFLSKLPEMKEGTLSKFGKLVEKVLNDINEFRFINIYMKRGGQLSGRLYCRSANVNFPVIDEFDRDDDTVWGIKTGKKDKANIAAVFRQILDLDVLGVESYSTGSDSTVAPFFDALMRTYIKIQQRINSLANLFKKVIPSLEDEVIVDLEWAGMLNELALYKGLLPTLSGNDKEDTSVVVSSAQPAPVVESTSLMGVVKEAAAKQVVDNRKLPPGFVSRDGAVAATFGLSQPQQSTQQELSPDDEVKQHALRQQRQQMVNAGYRAYGSVASNTIPAELQNNQPYGPGRPYAPQAMPTTPMYGLYQQPQPQQPVMMGIRPSPMHTL